MEWLPPNWCPSVVVIDIDGTITDGKKHLSTEAVQALRKLDDAGIPVVLATGTPVQSPTASGCFGPLHRCAVKTGASSGTSWDEPMLRGRPLKPRKPLDGWLMKSMGWT